MIPLTFVDGQTLPEPHRALLRPGDPAGGWPRWFYVVPSWEVAQAIRLSPHFTLSELMNVDVWEAEPLRLYPRYVPCAVTLLAAHLELIRQALGQPLHVAVNGGYRSPAHGRTGPDSPHPWGLAADLSAVGDSLLDDPDRLVKLHGTISRLLPAARLRPPRPLDDHLHLELGRVDLIPPTWSPSCP